MFFWRSGVFDAPPINHDNLVAPCRLFSADEPIALAATCLGVLVAEPAPRTPRLRRNNRGSAAAAAGRHRLGHADDDRRAVRVRRAGPAVPPRGGSLARRGHRRRPAVHRGQRRLEGTGALQARSGEVRRRVSQRGRSTRQREAHGRATRAAAPQARRGAAGRRQRALGARVGAGGASTRRRRTSTTP